MESTVVQPEPPATRTTWVDTLARVMERVVPDAITTSIILLVVLFGASIALSTGRGDALGTAVLSTMDAYYRGLWMMLAFTMQMTLILVLSLTLGASKPFHRVIYWLSKFPRNQFQVIALAVVCSGSVAYANWGLSYALGPLIAVHFAKEAERKGIKIDFLFLLATLGGIGSIWQFGFSASAPLLMATPGHFLESTTGIMPLSSTIWAPAAVTMVLVFTCVVIATGYYLMPKHVQPISAFPESGKLAEGAMTSSDTEQDEPGGDVSLVTTAKRAPQPLTFSKRLESSPWVVAVFCTALAGWLYVHFFVKALSLDINSLNTVFLLLGFAFHGSIASYTQALQKAVVSAWPVIVMYHLYAGVAGLIQFTPVGDAIVTLADPISTRYTYVLLTVVISTIVAMLVPTSGGQWLIQGLVTVKMADAVGVSPQRGLLALSVGDHMGNLITPFWAVVGASVAKIDFRLYFGYRLIFAALWFVLGTLAFTFLPS
jgi:short-chain fatty acids transporter